MRRRSHPGVVLVGAVLTLVVGAAPASAHDVLRSTNPPDGARLARVPSSIVLTFDLPALALGTQVVATGPAGAVSDGPPRLVDNTVTQDLQPGAPAGAYTVAWRVTSADGHPVSGTFAFTAAAASAGEFKRPADATGEPVRDAAGSRRAAIVGIPLVGVAVGALVVVALRRRRD